MLGVRTLKIDWIIIHCKEQKMEKYFIKKDGKFLNTVLEFDYNPKRKQKIGLPTNNARILVQPMNCFLGMVG